MQQIKTHVMALAACASLAIHIPAPVQAQALASHCTKTPQVSLLLVDQTDVFDMVDKARVADGISKMIGEVPGGSRLDIFAITNRPGNLTPGLQICVPQCDVVGQPDCDDALYLRHRQAFNSQIQQVVGSYIQNAVALDKSEILRSLFWLSREYEGRNVKNLYMFSDLIEYSDLNTTVSNYSRGTANQVLDLATKKVSPGRGFTQANVLVFGFGKRLGSQGKEQTIQAEIEKDIEEKKTKSAKPGDTKKRQPKPESFVLDTEALKNIDYFWQNYFIKLVGVKKVDIRLNY